jgi:hypothetical protein
MRQAKAPFQFVTASYLVRIRPETADSLAELTSGLRSCSNASIFHHTFQSLERHHYTFFSSDFAQWVLAACNEARLAERLAAVDVRDFVSFEALREAVIQPIEDHLERFPESAQRRAFEPFYFCEVRELSVPLDRQASNLDELAAGIEVISLQTIHYHFINSRVRLHLKTNDFSHWISRELDLPELAGRLDRIDIYMDTLDDLRRDIVATIRSWTDR